MESLRRQLSRLSALLAHPTALKDLHFRLEMCTSPEPGHPELQHDAMVVGGMCKEAVLR